MRTVLVVDSACDLPRPFIDEHGIQILPISVRIGDELFVDARDPDRTREFYERQRVHKSHRAETVPFSAQQIKDLFLERLVIDADYALVQTTARSRSQIWRNANDASHAILRDYKPIRKAAGVDGPFTLRVIDSQTLFAGQAALAAETIRLIGSGMKVNEIRSRIETLAASAHGYATFPDIYYARKRGRRKGDSSVSWWTAVMGTVLDIKPIVRGGNNRTVPVAKVRHYGAAVERIFDFTARHIEAGLLAPTVCISYAGDAEVIKQLPGYDRLLGTALDYDVELLTATMATCGSVNLGPGALTVGFIAEPGTFG